MNKWRKSPLRDRVYLAMQMAPPQRFAANGPLRVTLGDVGRLIEPAQRERERFEREALATAAVTR